MRACILVGPQTSEVKDVPMPVVGSGDVLVRVEACGVCFSEYHDWLGENRQAGYPRSMGHEPSGVIEQVGEAVEALEVGQHVAIMPTRRGAYTDYFGACYAEYVAAPAARVAVLPEGMRCAEAMGEPVACLVSAADRTPIRLGDRVAVVGCGFMGLGLLQLVALRGASEIIAIDIRDEALENALRLGADRVLRPAEVDPQDKLESFDVGELGQGIDVVFEVSGTQPGLTLAAGMVKAHGTLSVVGFHADGLRTVNLGLWNWKAFNLINAHERRNDVLMHSMRVGLGLIAGGKVDMASLVTHSFPLDHVDDAFRAMRDKPRGFIKGAVLPQT